MIRGIAIGVLIYMAIARTWSGVDTALTLLESGWRSLACIPFITTQLPIRFLIINWRLCQWRDLILVVGQERSSPCISLSGEWILGLDVESSFLKCALGSFLGRSHVDELKLCEVEMFFLEVDI